MAAGVLRWGRKSITGRAMRAGSARIQFDFAIDGVRYRPTLPWIPHEAKSSTLFWVTRRRAWHEVISRRSRSPRFDEFSITCGDLT